MAERRRAFPLARHRQHGGGATGLATHWLRLKKVTAVNREWKRADFAADKIRIAYLSADFHRHATAYLIAERSSCTTASASRSSASLSSGRPQPGARAADHILRPVFDVTARTEADAAKLLATSTPTSPST